MTGPAAPRIESGDARARARYNWAAPLATGRPRIRSRRPGVRSINVRQPKPPACS